MPLPPRIDEQIKARFETLILEIQELMSTDYSSLYGDELRAAKYTTSFVSLRTSSLSLLQLLATGGSHIARIIETVHRLSDSEPSVLHGILVGLKDDYESGMLRNLSEMIEANVAADYLGQAEKLLQEGRSGKYNYVPAAVLTGAILEDALRRLCQRQIPPVSVTKPNGEPKMMNLLIDDLKKANVFNELKAKLLRFWADIRNAAAHGEFEKFDRKDVEQMLTGVQNFLADYL